MMAPAWGADLLRPAFPFPLPSGYFHRKRFESRAPVLPELREPLIHFGKRCRVDRVDSPGATHRHVRGWWLPSVYPFQSTAYTRTQCRSLHRRFGGNLLRLRADRTDHKRNNERPTSNSYRLPRLIFQARRLELLPTRMVSLGGSLPMYAAF